MSITSIATRTHMAAPTIVRHGLVTQTRWCGSWPEQVVVTFRGTRVHSTTPITTRATASAIRAAAPRVIRCGS